MSGDEWGTDAQLVARCRAGDDKAWRELVECFSRYVYAICVQGFRLQESDAEDVFQEVFARTYQHLDRLRDDAAIKPWLAQLTRRCCIDHLRGSRAGETVPLGDDSALEPAALDEELERLDEALDVRDALELPSGTIASRISRCLTKLKDTMEGRKPRLTPSGGSVTR